MENEGRIRSTLYIIYAKKKVTYARVRSECVQKDR